MNRVALVLVALLALVGQRCPADVSTRANPLLSASDESTGLGPLLDTKIRFAGIVRRIHVGMREPEVLALLPTQRLPGEPYALSVPRCQAGRVVTYLLGSGYALRVVYGGPDHQVSGPAQLQGATPSKK